MRHLRDMRLPGGRAGTTLAELMVATVIMSVGILGLFGSFKYITRSLFISRAQTLATNLAQERIESLKNLNYYGLLITTAAATEPVTGIQYDNGNYGPERISIGGMNFTRYTYVAMADITSNVISTVSVNYPDTGMKQITVNVIWTDNGSTKKWTLSNLLENPNVNPLDATISGTVSISGGGNLSGAQLVVEQNSDWTATANASGSYSFKVYHGSYTVRASSTGFYDSISSPLSVSRNGTATANLTLARIATGTVAGIAWYNDGLMISQVVSDTDTTADDGNLHHIEYIELFNPTTFTINIGQDADDWPNKPITLFYGRNNGDLTYTWRYDLPVSWGSSSFGIHHISTYVAAGHYYLIANAPSFNIGGAVITADAYYDTRTPYATYISNTHAAAIGLYNTRKATWDDSVGWTNQSGDTPPMYGWPYIPNTGGGQGLGDPEGQQIVRVSSPAASEADTMTYGRAYNSGNNSYNFLYPSVLSSFIPPKSSASGTFPVLTGRVPSPLLVAASDTNSSALTTYQTTIASGALSLPYTPFRLTGVTTGTWTIALMYSGTADDSQLISNVTVSQNATTAIPSAATSPTWTAAGKYHVALTSTTDYGYVKGTVTDANGAAISGISVESGGSAKSTGSDGKYFMSVSSGTMNLVANPNNASNGTYTSSQYSVTVTAGGVTLRDFVLYKGARITGYVTTGTTPVPNQVVNAISGGNQMGTGTSDATGTFTIKNVSTGTYTFSPVLDMGQDSSPNSFPNMTISSTGTVFIGTFTISGAYGSIGGTITNASGLVTSGALIIASTQTIASSPPSIAASSAPAQTPFYMISSKADGTYSLPVRGSATYNLSAYVPSMSNSGTVSITTKTYSGIAVTVGGSVTKNITLP